MNQQTDAGRGPVELRRKYHPVDFGNRQWRRLLAYALDRADTFECALPYPIIVQDFKASPLWPPALEAFHTDLIDRHVSLIRWEFVHDYATQFARFKLTPELTRYIRAVSGLLDWSWDRDRPEDPTFLVGELPVLSTESADGRIAVYADDAEVGELMAVGIRLTEPLGVKAEPWPTP